MSDRANRSRVRIAQVATTAGSVHFLLTDHIERLSREGYDVEAVCAADDAIETVERRGIRVQRVPLVREPSPVADAKAIIALCRLFRSRRYDIVHSHTPKAGLLAPLAARLVGTPVVLHTVHGLLFHDRSLWKEKLLGAACEYWTAGLSHQMLSQSREDMGVMARLHIKGPRRVDYIGNGIDVRRFHPEVGARARQATRSALGIGADEVVVGMVGRFVREKGFIEFFRAMADVMAARPGVRALVIGPPDAGQSDGISMAEATAILASPRAIWLGRRTDLPELYSAMDIFALPSYREGIPRTAMEASAMGVSVVTSDIRGCREVVKDNLTGLLVPPRQADALTTAILRLVDDPGLRRGMGGAGRHHIEAEFNADVVLDRLAAYYEGLTARLPNGPQRG